MSRLRRFHTGLPGQVADRAVDLHVHLVQRLVHPLRATHALARQVAQLPVQDPQPGDRLARSKRPAQQPFIVPQLQPLAVDHVHLAAWHVAQLPGVRQHNLDAARLQHP